MKKNDVHRMKDIKQKVIVFILGLLLVFFILEVGLRVGGYFYKLKSGYLNTFLDNDDKSQFIVLCLGNSHTRLYPKHLQNLFDEKIKEREIKVINGGIDAENSAQILDELEFNINLIHPNLIILQTGDPDDWNHWGYNKYLEKMGHNTSFKTKIFSLNDYLYNFHVYRLMIVLKKDIYEKSVRKDYIDEEGYQNALMWKNEAVFYNKTLFSDKQKVEEAIMWFKKGVDLDPHYPENYAYLGDIYLNLENYDEALKWYIAGIKADLEGTMGRSELNNHYMGLRKLYSIAQEKRLNRLLIEIRDFFQEPGTDKPNSLEDTRTLSEKEIDGWKESNIREIIKIAQKKKVKIILQTYHPFIKSDRHKSVNIIISRISNDTNVPLVDQGRLFQEMWDKGENKQKYYLQFENALDDHLNPAGNRIAAENIFNVIMKENMLNLTEN